MTPSPDLFDAERTPTHHPLFDDVGWLLNRVWLGFGEHRAQVIAQFDLSVREQVVLDVLAAKEGTQLELASTARLDKSVMTTTIDKLERKGLVERVPDPADRRAKRPSLTGKGRRIQVEAAKASAAIQEELLDALPQPDKETFVRILQTFAFGQLAEAISFQQHPEA